MATAVANPAAKNYGTNILGIAAEQRDYFTPVVTSGVRPLTRSPNSTAPDGMTASLAADPGADKDDPKDFGLYPNVIEFRPPYSLTPVKQFYPVERYKGNPSPDPSIPGMQMGAGEIHFYLDATSAPFWIKHLLQAAGVTTLVFGVHSPTTDITLNLSAGSDSAFGTPSPIGSMNEPKEVLQGSNNFAAVPPEGMTGCKLHLTFATTTADIEVSGRDHNGAPVSEVLSDTATRTEQTTRFYYADEVKIATKATTDLAIGSIDYDLSDVYEHTVVHLYRGCLKV